MYTTKTIQEIIYQIVINIDNSVSDNDTNAQYQQNKSYSQQDYKNYNNKDKYNDVNHNIIANAINEDNKTDKANLIEANNKAR